jgi:hypothetical protein
MTASSSDPTSFLPDTVVDKTELKHDERPPFQTYESHAEFARRIPPASAYSFPRAEAIINRGRALLLSSRQAGADEKPVRVLDVNGDELVCGIPFSL